MSTAPRDSTENAAPGDNSLLSVQKPKVTRFSRRMLTILTIIAAAVLVFTVNAVFSKNRKAQGQKAAQRVNSTDSSSVPQPPDPLLSAPGKYSELPHRKSATNYGAEQPGVAGSIGGPASSSYGVQQTELNQTAAAGQVSPKEQSLREARYSPVTFPMAESVATIREEPPRTEIPVSAAPDPRLITTSVSTDQNMQGEKRRFTNERAQEFPYVKASLLAPLSQYEVKAGSILPALLITGINSDLPGQMVAQLRENVYDTVTGNYLLLPQGTRLIGEYDSKIAFGQKRVLVVWTRVIMPNGSSLSLEGMPGVDLSGYAGVTGMVNNHYGKLVTGVILGSIIGAGAQVAVGGQGTLVVPPSFEQMAVAGAASSINQAAQQHTSKVLNLQPTIEVAPGERINVFVTKDMILMPYQE